MRRRPARRAGRRARPPSQAVVLYKYRSLSNLQFALDILINKRMFAAQFERLNDPMEGSYLYEPDALQPRDIRRIYGEKASYRLLSLSKTWNNMLMWSYYSGGHTGIVVGVLVVDRRAKVDPVDYVDDLGIDLNHHDVARLILTRKLRMWEHEQEHRAFVQGKSFVKVQIKELIFGLMTNAGQKELVKRVAEQFCPDIRIRTITRKQLDRGNLRGVTPE
jgi:hypothetical protein